MSLRRPTPTKKAAPKKLAATKKAAPRRVVDDDDDEEEEAPRRSAKKGPTKHAISSDAVSVGWGGADQQAAKSNDFTNNLRLKDSTPMIVKFIDERPYASSRVHWLKREGRKSYICPQTADCPLCAGGSDTKFEARFSVALLTEEGPILGSLNAGKLLYDQLKDLNAKKAGPLPKHFYIYSKTGSNLQTRYKAEVIRLAQLQEEYPELYVPETDEVEALGRYTKDDVLGETTIEDLQEVADEVFGGGYDGDDEE